MKRLLVFLALAVGAMAQTPVISGVQDGGGYTPDVAQGEVFVVKGTNLSPSGYVPATAPNYPTTAGLNGVRITLTAVSGCARNISPMMPIVPAMNEPKAEIPSARPAFPCLAIWYPSRQVITEDASPGMLTRIDVVDPPYWAP